MSIVLQIKQEWHDPHIDGQPVRRMRGHTVIDPDEIKAILAVRPEYVIKRTATDDEELAIAEMMAKRNPPAPIPPRAVSNSKD